MSEGRKTTHDPAWREKYSDALMTADQAVARIRPGQRVFIGTGCAQPQSLVNALTARSNDLADTEIVHLLTRGDAPYATSELSRCFRVNSFFIAENVRGVIQAGMGDYTPIFLSDIPRLFDSGQLPLDAALVQVTPPDDRGFCSFGVSVDIVKSAAENASVVIAEVNGRMPRTLGDSFIHVRDIDILVPVDAPLIEVTTPEVDEDTRRIGEFIAALVEDGSTIEFGIGRIPHAAVEFLKDKRDLGIHTEMFTDSIIDLVECGAVTGRRKTIDQGKVVASFCMGTQRLYDYLDGNPAFAFHPTEHVNDPIVISQQHKQVAINVALEVDLTGQVCADSLGSRFFSGIGGQVDFNRGAARSRGGKAIIAMPSTARDGAVSRIVTHLSKGAGVVTTRGDVHYVITEHGVAYLHGKCIQDRAMALISIAHPKFRAQLLHEAIEAHYLRPDMADVEGKISIGVPDLRTTHLLDDGTQIGFRPIHPTDEPRMRDLFYNLSQETLYYRFMSRMKHVPRQQIHDFVFIDNRKDFSIVGTVTEAYGESIVAVGRTYLDEKTNMAEVAFVVQDKWQGRGIGTFMLDYLATIAKRNGISGFTAEVLATNKAMHTIIRKAPFKVESVPQEDVLSFKIHF